MSWALPTWVVDDVTSVRAEVAEWAGLSDGERWRLARLCARDAMWAARASGWFLSAEAIAMFKLLFFRGKDVVDLQRLIAVRPELDRTYIRRWIVEMMGEDDEPTRMWDQLVDRFSPP